MSEKTLKNIRIVHKHDTEENWLKAINFIPKQGELIIYDVDDTYNYERFKIGDGQTLVSDLPFMTLHSWNDLEDKPFGEDIIYSGDVQFIIGGGGEPSADLTFFSIPIVGKEYIIKVNEYVFTATYQSIYLDQAYGFRRVNDSGDELYLYRNTSGGYTEIRFKTKEWIDNPELIPDIYDAHVKIYGVEPKQLDEIYIPDTIARVKDILIPDSTLTLSETPAEAKAVGDALNLKVDKIELGGMVEITNTEPINPNTVLIIHPEQSEGTNIYTAEEIDSLLANYTPGSSSISTTKFYVDLLNNRVYFQGKDFDYVYIIKYHSFTETGASNIDRYSYKFNQYDAYGDLVFNSNSATDFYNIILQTITDSNSPSIIKYKGLYNDCGYNGSIAIDSLGGLSVSFGKVIIRFESGWDGSSNDPT